MELSSMWKQDRGPCFLAGCWLSLSQLLEAIHTSRHVTPFPHLQSQKPWIESFTCFESLWLLLLPHLSCFQPEKVFCFKEVMWLDWANPDNTWQSLYFMKVKVQSLSPVGLFATPWTVSYQVPPPIGFSRQEYLSGLPFPSPGDLPNLGIKPQSPALQADALPSELLQFEAPNLITPAKFLLPFNIAFLFFLLYVMCLLCPTCLPVFVFVFVFSNLMTIYLAVCIYSLW